MLKGPLFSPKSSSDPEIRGAEFRFTKQARKPLSLLALPTVL
jgi:hypothetical protein